MPDSAIVTVANAVTSLITGASFELTPTAVTRCYVPNFNIEDQPGLQVFVLTMTQVIDVTGGDRSASMDVYTVTIAIYQQVSRDTGGQIVSSEVDGLLYFVQQVIDLLKANDLEGGGGLIAVRNKPVFDPAQLDKNGTFMSVIEADYLLYR
jgi:hypothetical protein